MVQLTGFRFISAAAEGPVTLGVSSIGEERAFVWVELKCDSGKWRAGVRVPRGHPHPALRAPYPFCPFGTFPPDRGNRPFPLGGGLAGGQRPPLRRKTDRERWLGKLRRRPGTTPRTNFANPGPSGPAGFLTRTQILRAGNVLPTPRDNPRKWGPGKGDYEHEVLIWSRPRRSFGFFPIVGKETRPAGRNSPAYNKCSPKPAPSSGPFGATFPYPLCRFATSPLDKGSRPPGGRFKKRRRNPP